MIEFIKNNIIGISIGLIVGISLGLGLIKIRFSKKKYQMSDGAIRNAELNSML